MSAMQPEILNDHEYDGIQEYDNPTPGWWNWLFFGTFVFSVAYFAYYELAPAMQMAPTERTIEAAYQTAVADNLKQQFGEIGDLEADEATILRFMNDERWLTVAKVTFEAQCKSCHGGKAEGLTGPNMTDDYYKNVRKLTDIAKVIKQGANNNAMPAWENKLHPNEIVLLSSYLASLRGQNLDSTRQPEGEVIPPWPTAPANPEGAEQPEKS